jgi:RNA-directed DNA polymerase
MKTFRKNLLPGTLRRHATYWGALESPDDLAVLVNTPAHQYLQAAYHFQRPDCVHGSCISPRNEDDRNILSNAQRHLGRAYLLNLDLEDFFHHVTWARVEDVLASQLPHARPELIALLCRLVTRHGRLPMGGPTSPILSNYACLGLDADLETLAQYCGLRYTRYADDLSFSGAAFIGEKDEGLLRGTIEGYGFKLNEEKVKQYGPGDEKLVTGLVVGEEGVRLQNGYLDQLQVEIARLQTVLMVDRRYHTGMSNRKLKLFKQELRGKMNFARLILGSEDSGMQAVEQAYEDATMAPAEYESASWLEITYAL